MARKKSSKGFRQAITLQQVGAKPVRIKGKTMYRLGGGLFTKNQVLKSRLNFGRAVLKRKFKKSAVGL